MHKTFAHPASSTPATRASRPSRDRGLTRRSLLAAAWGAPVIALAVAAPAQASSQAGNAVLQFQNVHLGMRRNYNRTPNTLQGYEGNLGVQTVYKAQGDTVKTIELRIEMPTISTAANAGPGSVLAASSAGWVAQPTIVSGSATVFRFTYSGSLSSVSPAGTRLEFTLPASGGNVPNAAVPVQFTATSPQAALPLTETEQVS